MNSYNDNKYILATLLEYCYTMGKGSNLIREVRALSKKVQEKYTTTISLTCLLWPP